MEITGLELNKMGIEYTVSLGQWEDFGVCSNGNGNSLESFEQGNDKTSLTV